VEEKELKYIRTVFVPEVIFAYHSALYFSGQAIGREILAQCMTLAVTVAESAALLDCFVEAKRVPELVEAFAISSMEIMSGKEMKLKKRLPDNATLDIWKVKPIEGDGAITGVEM
jgi:nuclear pore complex protein Nup107